MVAERCRSFPARLAAGHEAFPGCLRGPGKLGGRAAQGGEGDGRRVRAGAPPLIQRELARPFAANGLTDPVMDFCRPPVRSGAIEKSHSCKDRCWCGGSHTPSLRTDWQQRTSRTSPKADSVTPRRRPAQGAASRPSGIARLLGQPRSTQRCVLKVANVEERFMASIFESRHRQPAFL